MAVAYKTITGSAKRITRKFFGEELFQRIRDSKRNFDLTLMHCDYDKAQPKQFADCAIVYSVKRTCGSPKILVFRHYAYLQLLDRKGEWEVVRFQIDKDLRKAVVEFDRNKTRTYGTFQLLAVPESQTLKFKKAKYNTEYAPRVLLIDGKYVRVDKNGKPTRKGNQGGPAKIRWKLDESVRNGVGKISCLIAQPE